MKPDHRLFRPAGWVEAGRERLALVRPIAERHDLTLLQLACQWTLAQPAVSCVVPTLIQEPGPEAKPVEAERAELASMPHEVVLSAEELAEIERVGDNTGSMLLKGGSPRTRATSGQTRGRSTRRSGRRRTGSASCRSAISCARPE